MTLDLCDDDQGTLIPVQIMSAPSRDNRRIKCHEGTEQQQKMLTAFCRLEDAPVGCGVFFL